MTEEASILETVLAVLPEIEGRVAVVFWDDLNVRELEARLRGLDRGTWDAYFGHGIVGGALVSGAGQGRAAAELALRILAGARIVVGF